MRSGIILFTIMVMALSLQGCGRKGSLSLPVNQARPPVATTPDPQKADVPSIPSGK